MFSRSQEGKFSEHWKMFFVDSWQAKHNNELGLWNLALFGSWSITTGFIFKTIVAIDLLGQWLKGLIFFGITYVFSRENKLFKLLFQGFIR